MRVVARLLAGVVGAVSGAGCERTLEQACYELAEAECGHLEACSPALLAASWGDLAACERRIAEGCVRLPSLPGAALGPAEIDACAAAYGGHPCESLVLRAPPLGCRFTGMNANGTGCVAGAQCQSSSCRTAASEGDGQCAAVRSLGDPCSLGGSPCDIGLYCGPSGRCVAYGTLGDTCSAVVRCNPLYWCFEGTCAAPGEEGDECAPCSGEATCDLLEGLVCDGEGLCGSGDASSLVGAGAGTCW